MCSKFEISYVPSSMKVYIWLVGQRLIQFWPLLLGKHFWSLRRSVQWVWWMRLSIMIGANLLGSLWFMYHEHSLIMILLSLLSVSGKPLALCMVVGNPNHLSAIATFEKAPIYKCWGLAILVYPNARYIIFWLQDLATIWLVLSPELSFMLHLLINWSDGFPIHCLVTLGNDAHADACLPLH